MTEAILGTFSEVKILKTRSVLQIVIEVPIEQADHALKMLGGIPQPGTERWVGIALAPKERKAVNASGTPDDPNILGRPKEHRKFAELPLSQQAGIRSNDQQFWDFLNETYPSYLLTSIDFIPAAVRDICHVASRSELDTNDLAGAKWRKLEEDFQAYKTDLRYAGTARL